MGCTHSDSFTTRTYVVGPFSDGPDVPLTLNSDQDYWPTWTSDGRGILYAFVDATRPDSVSYGKRCMGILPAIGGTRLWQWCDDRAALFDSLSSFPAYALDAGGQLLYAESTIDRRLAFTHGNLKLWLADTLHPYRRRNLLTFPVTVGDSVADWLADVAWTGTNTFTGLAQNFLIASHCTGAEGAPKCAPIIVDTMFFGELVVRGTINANGATLTAVPGTAGATTYAPAEGGASIVFTTRNSTTLWRVPAAGGTPVAVGAVTSVPGMKLVGVSCKGITCIVAVAPLTPWAPVIPGPKIDVAKIDPGVTELRTISLVSGATTVVYSKNSGVLSCPAISPVSGDVVVEYGLNMGHLQTWTSSSADLHLLNGLVL
jgi:hypothetical protein